MSNFKTDQEAFWAGEFGTNYISRNKGSELLASNLNFFSKALRHCVDLTSCLEFGANIGMNMQAIKLLFPSISAHAIEINKDAATILSEIIGKENVHNGSILEYDSKETKDLVLIKGVLIHINPDELPNVYKKLYDASKNYILIAEYYNPSPVAIPYRGHSDRLYKRDFAGEIMELYSDLKLIDYGFVYKNDPTFPQDDITWFLMKKGA